MKSTLFLSQEALNAQFGLNGLVRLTESTLESTAVRGIAIQAIDDNTVISALGCNVDGTEVDLCASDDLNLANGVIIYGDFTGCTITSGDILYYKRG